jgi:hypothetical protein
LGVRQYACTGQPVCWQASARVFMKSWRSTCSGETYPAGCHGRGNDKSRLHTGGVAFRPWPDSTEGMGMTITKTPRRESWTLSICAAFACIPQAGDAESPHQAMSAWLSRTEARPGAVKGFPE